MPFLGIVFRLAALASSVTLFTGFVAFRAGAFNEPIAQMRGNTAVLSGSKSASVIAEIPFDDAHQSAKRTLPAMMPGSKAQPLHWPPFEEKPLELKDILPERSGKMVEPLLSVAEEIAEVELHEPQFYPSVDAMPFSPKPVWNDVTGNDAGTMESQVGNNSQRVANPTIMVGSKSAVAIDPRMVQQASSSLWDHQVRAIMSGKTAAFWTSLETIASDSGDGFASSVSSWESSSVADDTPSLNVVTPEPSAATIRPSPNTGSSDAIGNEIRIVSSVGENVEELAAMAGSNPAVFSSSKSLVAFTPPFFAHEKQPTPSPLGNRRVPIPVPVITQNTTGGKKTVMAGSKSFIPIGITRTDIQPLFQTTSTFSPPFDGNQSAIVSTKSAVLDWVPPAYDGNGHPKFHTKHPALWPFSGSVPAGGVLEIFK